MRKSIIPAVGLIVLLTTGAFAEDHHDGLSGVIARGRAGVSLQTVISNVEEKSKGKVYEIRFEKIDKMFSFTDGPLVYQVETLTPEGVYEYMVDPADGKIMSTSKDRLAGFRYKNLTGDIKITLGQAVTKAEQVTGLKAVSAGLEEEDGFFIYLVKMNTDSPAKRSCLVDPLNGKVYPISHRENHDH